MEFNYSKTSNAGNSSNSGTKTYNDQAGSVPTILETIGVLNEQTGQMEVEVSTGISLTMKFKGQNRASKVFFPTFLVENKYNEEGKLNFRNYLNNRSFMKDNVLQVNPTNIDIATKNFLDKYVAWATDLLSVYSSEARNLALNFLRWSEYKSNFYECIGYYYESKFESLDGNAEPELKTGEKSSYYMQGDVLLKSIEEHGYTMLYKPNNIEGNLDEVLEAITQNVNQQTIIFLNYVIAKVNELNVGQKGYTFQTWTISGEKSYLNVVTNLNSLVTSVGTSKKGDNWEIVTPENQDQFPAFTKYYYGGVLGLDSKQLSTKINDKWVSRLQFVFRAEPFNSSIEGTDTTVTYRSKYNPLLCLDKPQLSTPIIEDKPVLETVDNDTEDSGLPF